VGQLVEQQAEIASGRWQKTGPPASLLNTKRKTRSHTERHMPVSYSSSPVSTNTTTLGPPLPPPDLSLAVPKYHKLFGLRSGTTSVMQNTRQEVSPAGLTDLAVQVWIARDWASAAHRARLRLWPENRWPIFGRQLGSRPVELSAYLWDELRSGPKCKRAYSAAKITNAK
jgi:hypothetical protein